MTSFECDKYLAMVARWSPPTSVEWKCRSDRGFSTNGIATGSSSPPLPSSSPGTPSSSSLSSRRFRAAADGSSLNPGCRNDPGAGCAHMYTMYSAKGETSTAPPMKSTTTCTTAPWPHWMLTEHVWKNEFTYELPTTRSVLMSCTRNNKHQ